MQIVYLDQNHWIELARAANQRQLQPETPALLEKLRTARRTGRGCFPLSLGHYIETLKQQAPDRRSRLAAFMLELSGGATVAPPHVVLRHEMQAALDRCLPGRIKVEPLHFLGKGLSHAADRDFGFQLEWPAEAQTIPAPQRQALQDLFLSLAAHSLLSGVLPTGHAPDLGPATNLRPDRRFRDGLAEWRGAAARYPLDELERRIYATTLADVSELLWEILASNQVAIEDFAVLGEARWRAFLDDMPSRVADMQLRRQWAKNAGLTPRESDLNDWAYLGVAVCYCDVVATEKQTADLLSRDFKTRARVVSRLADLPALVE